MKDKVIMITGGTGSFGQAMTDYLLAMGDRGPKKIIIFSRDEFKQQQMMKRLGEFPGGKLRFFIGDVRDKNRLMRAMRGVDYVFHAAALKHVDLCEYNPWEAVQTNIIGSQNVVDCAISCYVSRVVALSSDKAVNPINLYGGTKLVLEKLFVDANAISDGNTRFSVVRYGNVLASRGSVLQTFIGQRDSGVLKITDPKMTRFWWTLDMAVKFVMIALDTMVGGEIYIPVIKSSLVTDLAKIICPGCKFEFTGIRPGEKIHESLIAPDEIRRTYFTKDYYYIRPEGFFTFGGDRGILVNSDFSYTSDKQLMDNPGMIISFMLQNIG